MQSLKFGRWQCFIVYIPWAIKTCHFIFNYNSGITCSIIIIFCTSRNRKKYCTIYLFNGLWCHNSVTVHVTKFYFIQLVIIKYVQFEDNPKNCRPREKTVGLWKVFCQKTDKRISYQNWKYEHTNFGRLSAKVANNRLIDRTQYALRWLTSKCAVYTPF